MSKNKYISYGVIATVITNSTAALASTPQSVNGGARLYGVPDSVTSGKNLMRERLRISMSKSAMPHSIWREIETVNEAWIKVYNGKLNYTELNTHLENNIGSSESMSLLKGTLEYDILDRMSNDDILSAFVDGNYEYILNEIMHSGILQSDYFAEISSKIEEALRKDSTAFEELKNLDMLKNLAENQDIIELKQLIGSENEIGALCSVAAAACIAFVAVGVAIYAVAAVNGGVGVNLGAFLSIVTETAVFTSSQVLRSNQLSLGQLRPELEHTLETIDKVSKLTGDPRLYSLTLLEFKKNEVKSVLDAAINVGIFELDKTAYDQTIEKLNSIIEAEVGY